MILYRKLPSIFHNNGKKLATSRKEFLIAPISVVPWHAKWQVHKRNKKRAKVLRISIREKQPPTLAQSTIVYFRPILSDEVSLVVCLYFVNSGLVPLFLQTEEEKWSITVVKVGRWL